MVYMGRYWERVKKITWLTIIAVATKELVEADEVGSIAELWTLGDEDLLNELEAVDDNTRHGAQGNAVDVAVYFGQGGQALERWFVGCQKV